jgi:peptide deformylase
MKHEQRQIICWPDPRLLEASLPVERFDADLAVLVKRMLHLMHEAKGVGLAAPQVGVNRRLFVMNPTTQPGDDRIYINPVFQDSDGQEEGEEGCLSLPGLSVKVVRAKQALLKAQDLEGQSFEQTAEGYVARIWQHEYDHLDGTLLIHRMTPLAKLGARRLLKELRGKYDDAKTGPQRKAAAGR